MGRRKRNQDKRKKEEKRLAKLNSKDESNKNVWFIVFCAVIVFVMFYLLTVYITNKNNPKKDSSSQEEDTKSVGETIIGRSFSMSSEPYLVFYYDTSDKDVASDCENLFTNYRGAYGDKSIYFVDMNSGFNKAFATTEESNKNPQSPSELAINGPTLIKIQENKAVEYIEGLEAIEEYLK